MYKMCKIWESLMSNKHRAKQKGRPGGARPHVHVLPARQFAVARVEGRHVEGALSKDWWYKTSDTNWSTLRRPSWGDGHIPALRTQTGLFRDAGLRVLEKALPWSVRKARICQWWRVWLDRQDDGACKLILIILVFLRKKMLWRIYAVDLCGTIISYLKKIIYVCVYV